MIFSVTEPEVGFLIHAICEFGDPEETRIAAVQGMLDAAGFDARATCWPIFGGIWRKPCEGPDAEVASAWLKDLTDNLRRGDANDEICQLRFALDARRDSNTDSEQVAR